MEKKTVTNTKEGRLDVLLSESLALSRSALSKAVKAGRVLVDGNVVTQPAYTLRGGETLTLLPEKDEGQKGILPPKDDRKLDFVYKDKDVAVIDKPRGLVVHPAPGHRDDTIVNYLFKDEQDFDFDENDETTIRPGIVHRIDKDTSGLLAVAMNEKSQAALQEEIRSREFHRTYLALAEGRIRDRRFRVDAPLTRPNHSQRKALVDPVKGRDAVTHFATLAATDKASLLLCRLETGRTHQIRAHLAYIGHPLVGDTLYSKKRYQVADKGQALHAFSLSFLHPETLQRLTFYAPLDDYMKFLLRSFFG